MHEIVINLHMHTRYSDGSGTHRDIARAALRSGLDAVIVTDHNIWIAGMERYFCEGGRSVLVLIGEEVHNRNRVPQKEHVLALGVNQEIADFGGDPQSLFSAIGQRGGLSFIAHPIDPAAPAFNEPDISWEDWSRDGFTGLELWNGFSELKSLIPTRLHGFFFAFFPALVAHAPSPEAIHRWDRLLLERPIVAIGGSDAHALRLRSGPVRRTVYPYDYHFRAVNTHVLLRDPMTGDVERDAREVYRALAAGHCFVGNDLPRSTRGFRFSAIGPDSEALMGDQISGRADLLLQAQVPFHAEIRLIRNGQIVEVRERARDLRYAAKEAGIYRVEAYTRYAGRRRGLIFSNPIYVR